MIVVLELAGLPGPGPAGRLVAALAALLGLVAGTAFLAVLTGLLLGRFERVTRL